MRCLVKSSRHSATQQAIIFGVDDRIALARCSLESLPVDAVKFDDSAEAGTAHAPAFYRSSRILSGTVTVITAGDRRTTLRPKETLLVSNLREARVVSLDVGTGSVHLSLVGRAAGIAVGAEHRDLRPTRFESWNANQPIKLYWGAASYLFGLALAALRVVRKKSA